MAIILFSLRGVPEDEAQEIRDLLILHEIDFYETSAGNWGISMPAIWLHQDQELLKAKALLEAYHIQRADQQRALFRELKQKGQSKTFQQELFDRPLRLLVYIGACAAVLYLSLKMVMDMLP